MPDENIGRAIRFPNGILDAPTSYGAWIDDCEARIRRGEKQRYCTRCCKWRWDGEKCCNAPRQTVRQFNALMRKFERMTEQQLENVIARCVHREPRDMKAVKSQPQETP